MTRHQSLRFLKMFLCMLPGIGSSGSIRFPCVQCMIDGVADVTRINHVNISYLAPAYKGPTNESETRSLCQQEK